MPSTEKPGWVSIWVCFERHPADVDVLKQLCGVKRYDVGSQELLVEDETWQQQPIGSLLGRLSYSASFSADALAASVERGITAALFVVAQFDMVFRPARGGPPPSPDPTFLGSFRWSDYGDD